jgi:hypothetical protein
VTVNSLERRGSLPQNMWKYECRESGGTSWYGAPYKCSCGATSKYVSWFNTIMEAMAWYQKHYGLKPNGGRVGDILTFLKRLPHSRKNFCGVSIRGLVGTRQGMIREGERSLIESGTMGIAGTSAYSSTVPIERTHTAITPHPGKQPGAAIGTKSVSAKISK